MDPTATIRQTAHHSPAPFTERWADDRWCCTLMSAEEREVAGVYMVTRAERRDEEGKANLRLFKAAPELLNLARACLALLDDQKGCSLTREALRDTIAKIEGRED